MVSHTSMFTMYTHMIDAVVSSLPLMEVLAHKQSEACLEISAEGVMRYRQTAAAAAAAAQCNTIV